MSEDTFDSDIGTFVQEWFDLLSAHKPVELLLPFIADSGLEMVFPERTLRSHADFTDWYAVVGEAYTDQTHVVEEITIIRDGRQVDLTVTVVWTATSTADGTVSSSRVRQNWELRLMGEGNPPLITGYHVGAMQEV